MILVLVPVVAWTQGPLIENSSFELGTESPQGWELSGGAFGKWELFVKLENVVFQLEGMENQEICHFGDLRPV